MTRQNRLDYDPCPYRNFCREYNSLVCNGASFQETCLPFMEFKFEEKESERMRDNRGSR